MPDRLIPGLTDAFVQLQDDPPAIGSVCAGNCFDLAVPMHRDRGLRESA